MLHVLFEIVKWIALSKLELNCFQNKKIKRNIVKWKPFLEQYMCFWLILIFFKKQKFMKVLKFCELFFHFFCTILYEHLKILRKEYPSMHVKTKLMHVNTEKNPDFYFLNKCDEKIFFSHVEKSIRVMNIVRNEYKIFYTCNEIIWLLCGVNHIILIQKMTKSHIWMIWKT